MYLFNKKNLVKKIYKVKIILFFKKKVEIINKFTTEILTNNNKTKKNFAIELFKIHYY